MCPLLSVSRLKDFCLRSRMRHTAAAVHQHIVLELHSRQLAAAAAASAAAGADPGSDAAPELPLRGDLATWQQGLSLGFADPKQEQRYRRSIVHRTAKMHAAATALFILPIMM